MGSLVAGTDDIKINISVQMMALRSDKFQKEESSIILNIINKFYPRYLSKIPNE